MSEYNREQGRDIRTSTPAGAQGPDYEQRPEGWADDPNRRRESVEEEYRMASQQGSGVSEQAKEKASEYGEKAREQVETGREQAAEGIGRAASTLRERSSGSSGMAAEAGTKVADKLEGAAGYLRDHNTSDMMSDFEEYVRHHPGQAVAGAVVTGFLIGRILR